MQSKVLSVQTYQHLETNSEDLGYTPGALRLRLLTAMIAAEHLGFVDTQHALSEVLQALDAEKPPLLH